MSFSSPLKWLFKKTFKDLPEWLRKRRSFSEQIREMRDLLSMTQGQLARRSSLNPRHIRNLESLTENADPQLSTLMKVADGLECELLIDFIPREPIQKLMEGRAQIRARQIMKFAKGSTAMEEQQPEDHFTEMRINAFAQELLQKPSQIWEDD